MNELSAKIIYGMCLLVLAACAVAPRHTPAVQMAVATPAPIAAETKLARAIGERVAIEAVGGPNDHRLKHLSAEAEGLRRLAFAADARGARETLIDALADELSAALARRMDVSTRRDPGHPERIHAEAVVRGLTAAINAEVHGQAI